MSDGIKYIEDLQFSTLEIYAHLEKIFSSRLFEPSEILKRFLSFVVKETLEGNTNRLKEYTIGVYVLNKPPNYKPQQNGIVRIHACRLRRALHIYYQQEGQHESIRISIPKGSYIPLVNGKSSETAVRAKVSTQIPARPLVVAVFPCSYYTKYKTDFSFAEGLAAQLSTELGQLKDITVIAYHTRHLIEKKIPEIKKDLTTNGVQYVFVSEIHRANHRYRINIQLIKIITNEQVWGKIFEHNLVSFNIFEIQDNVVNQTILEFSELRKTLNCKLPDTQAKTITLGSLTPINNSFQADKHTLKKSLSA